MLALMEAVERCQDRLQGRSLHIQRLGDGNIPAFGMGMMLGPASALGLQPPVELGQAGEPEPRLEEAASDCLDLLLDLDRKSTRLNPVPNAHLVCRLLLEKKKHTRNTNI